MNLGELRDRVVLQTYTDTTQEEVFTKPDWIDTVEVWAKIEALRGREFFEAKRVRAETYYKITIRYRQVDTSMRIRYGDKILMIDAVIPDTKKRYVQLICYERDDKVGT